MTIHDSAKSGSAQPKNLLDQAKAKMKWEAIEIPDLFPKEIQLLAHELRTYQVELEIQNEELLRRSKI